NPSWCHKVYKGPGPSEPIITRSVEYGVIPSDECDSIDNYVLECEKELPNSHKVIEGIRVVELNYVIQETLWLQKKLYQLCSLGDLVVTEEIRKGSGLVSTNVLWCHICKRSYSFQTEDPKKNVSGINLGHVWGTLVTGSTYEHSAELMSCMNIPTMPQKQFQKYELHLGEVWKTSLWESMENAGKRERNYALEKSNVCQDGTPWITVYVDGSWSKRSYDSYGTNYNALSGM
ncbi:hypothetical protein NQ315_012743, partial [Exocentrus adspersus]